MVEEKVGGGVPDDPSGMFNMGGGAALSPNRAAVLWEIFQRERRCALWIPQYSERDEQETGRVRG